MSIGALGSSGEQFRDFLGGNQQDIGQGLQAVLGAYTNVTGNPNRLDQRTQAMFQLTNSEYLARYNQDAQNSFAKTWYEEYRAVLQLRADALKKKLNMAYTRVLERSMYAPVRPGEKWAPQANRDQNDIDADDPTNLPGTLAAITPPTGITPPPEGFIHPDWFGPAGNRATGNPYDDIRTYINEQYPLSDMDGDGRTIGNVDSGGQTFDTTSNTYDTSEEQANPSNSYYDLWDEGMYDLNSVKSLSGESAIRDKSPFGDNAGTSTADWWKEISQEMNVPPESSTQDFVLNAGAGNQYYAAIPRGNTTQDIVSAGLGGLLPTVVTSKMEADGTFTNANKLLLSGSDLNWKQTNAPSPAPAAIWVLHSPTVGPRTKFYDTRSNVNQDMFGAGSYAGPATGINGGITLNTQLARPGRPAGLPGGPPNDAAADLADSSTLPEYQQDFVDSWLEGRALQKREAQVEAAYQAYLDGKTLIKSNPDPDVNSMTYNEIMDQVFASLDMMNPGPIGGPGGSATIGNPFSGPGSAGLPPQMPASVDIDISSTMPFGAHIIQSGPGSFSVSGSANTDYAHGRDPGGSPASYDGGSIYGMIFERLKLLGQDPFNSASGTENLSGATPPTPPGPAGAGTYGIVPGTANSGQSKLSGSVNQNDESSLMKPLPVGAAENPNDSSPNINIEEGVANLNDTFYEVPPNADTLDNISKLFVGRQWDVVPGADPDNPTAHFAQGKGALGGVGAVHYDAKTISAHMMALPGWYGGAADHAPGDSSGVLLTMSPPIEAFALQTAANFANFGQIDDATNRLLGGPFLRVGGGSDAAGPIDFDGDKSKYNIGAGFGMGALGMFWGHTSAIGRIRDIEYLMTDPGIIWDIFTASIKGLASIGGGSGGDMSVFPNVGLVGTNLDLNIPIPIPIPFVGLFWLNIPMTTYGGMSYDILTDYMSQFLDSMRHEILDSVSVFSYATSGGYAMDSYGMRGEYHFTEKTAYSALYRMPSLFGLDFGGFADTIIGSALGGSEAWGGEMNHDALETRLMRYTGASDTGVRHSYNAGEARELDTGAFFTTAAFLSQFQSAGTNTTTNPGLEYSYWTQTQHNEEMANMDMLRMLLLSGKDIMLMMSKALFASAGAISPTNTYAYVTLQIMNYFIEGMQDSVNEAAIWDLLLHDQSQEGYVTSSKIRASGLTSEGYDFIEDERKLFQNDYTANTKKGFITTLIEGATGTFETPNQILNGYANTRRYKPYLVGPDGTAGRQGYATANGLDGTLAHPTLYDPSRPDENWNIHRGFWNDTGLGDMNEVYVRKNTVTYGATDHGIGADANVVAPTVSTSMDRYVGSHNRIFGRGYDGGAPVNLQSFRTGYYANKYFGTYVGTSATVDAPVTQTISGVDGDPNAQLTLHGGQGYYDRTKDYSLSYKALNATSAVQLDAKTALAPTLGGQLKISSLDVNNATNVDQLLGKDTTGKLNELNKVIHDHLRVKDDGSNLKLIRNYRDVFNSDFLDDVFVSVSANSPMGGGVTSSIRLKFNQEDPFDDVAGMLATNLSAIEQDYDNRIGGTGSLTVMPSYLGRETVFKNASQGRVDVYLNSYFAFRRDPKVASK